MDKLVTSRELLAALERAKAHVMTPAEIRAQRRSFVVGMLNWPDKSHEEIRAIVSERLGQMGM